MRTPALVGVIALLAVVLAAPQASASFPGANGKIAFIIFNANPLQIAVVDPDGSNRQTLTTTAHRANFDPAWSYNGAYIAFASAASGVLPKLRVMNADGSNQIEVVTMSSKYLGIYHPSFSPDGNLIAFCAVNQQSKGKIFTVATDGSATLTKLSPKGADDCYPDWSPDGATIAFNSFASDRSEIWVMDANGANRTDLGEGVWPTWSPDGTMITYSKTVLRRFDVFVMNANGSGTTRVTHTRKRWEFRPVFSPDGTQIAYSRTIGESSGDSDDIWTFTIAGATFEQLTNTPKIDEYGVSWQPIPI
jgi:Tol biopolymer transport system component